MAEPKDLIIVCCHAIYLDPTCSADPFSESSWALASFQQSSPSKPGEHETFLRHLGAGLDELINGSWGASSLVVLSGGATKQATTTLSEAQSYFNAALALGGERASVAKAALDTGRLLLEEHATDSYQNLLFSLLAFHRQTGRYPARIRVVTHAFKTKRFLDLHAAAIGWPQDCITVLGIDPPMSLQEFTETVEGEYHRGYLAWKRDPYGIESPLASKRAERGWAATSALPKLCLGIEEEPVQALLRSQLCEMDVEKLPWAKKEI